MPVFRLAICQIFYIIQLKNKRSTQRTNEFRQRDQSKWFTRLKGGGRIDSSECVLRICGHLSVFQFIRQSARIRFDFSWKVTRPWTNEREKIIISEKWLRLIRYATRVNDLIWDDSNMGHYEENMPVSQ